MQFFSHEGFELAYIDEGTGDPVLLVHGFGSNIDMNWVGPGWAALLEEAGYRVVAFDHRGHGKSSVSYDQADYSPSKMAGDAAALLDHLDIPRAHVFGYSMGARVAAFMALEHSPRVATLVLGGLGSALFEGVGDWDAIAEALLADDPAAISDPRAAMFRTFADQTQSDRQALAACIATSRAELTPEELGRIGQPALVAVGTRDDIGGPAAPLAALLPHGVAFDIERRDHMRAVGDRSFQARVLEFYRQNPL